MIVDESFFMREQVKSEKHVGEPRAKPTPKLLFSNDVDQENNQPRAFGSPIKNSNRIVSPFNSPMKNDSRMISPSMPLTDVTPLA